MMRIAIANHVPQQKETWRVTLTWPVINRARDVFFLIEGADKVAALKQVFTRPLRSGNISIAVDQACQPPHHPSARFCRRRRIAPARGQWPGQTGDRAMILAGDVGGTKVRPGLMQV